MRFRNTHTARVIACVVVAGVLVTAAARGQTDDAGLYLYVIPSTLADGEQGTLAKTVVADLYVERPMYLADRLAASSGLTLVASADDHVRVSVTDGVVLAGDPAADHMAATFVIDYDQPSVGDILYALHEEHGPEPSTDVLVDFVSTAISSKSYRRSFDIASQVANTLEGDCTEHAVLLTALARATHKPARVVLGVMMVEHGGVLRSFGHAWSEIHDGEGWQIADATRPALELPDARIRYLPLLPLRDEGAGYAMQLMEFAVIKPARIEQIQTLRQ